MCFMRAPKGASDSLRYFTEATPWNVKFFYVDLCCCLQVSRVTSTGFSAIVDSAFHFMVAVTATATVETVLTRLTVATVS